MTKIYYFVNGILTIPGASANWTGKAVTGLHRRLAATPTKAEKVEYYTGPFSRVLFNIRRARRLLKVNSYYGEFEKVVVAHSNGADVVLDALKVSPFNIKTLLLISPAVPSDCTNNGNCLSTFMKSGLVERLQIWIGMKDIPLRLGRTGLGRLLGYGALGLDGPRGLEASPEVRVESEFGHSTWFDDEHIEDTLDRFAVL